MNQDVTPQGNLAAVLTLPRKKKTLLEEFKALGTGPKINAREMSQPMKDALAESRAQAGQAKATHTGGMREVLTELRS